VTTTVLLGSSRTLVEPALNVVTTVVAKGVEPEIRTIRYLPFCAGVGVKESATAPPIALQSLFSVAAAATLAVHEYH
jgi:hypothetical protein